MLWARRMNCVCEELIGSRVINFEITETENKEDHSEMGYVSTKDFSEKERRTEEVQQGGRGRK